MFAGMEGCDVGESSMWGAVGWLVNVEGRCVLRAGLGKLRPRGWASERGESRGCTVGGEGWQS